MGAYENPPLFKIPNYGQIFQQSFQAAQKQTQAAFDRIAQREKERKAEAAAERREKEAQFKDLASFSGALGKIDAGSATLALQNTTGDMTKEYAELQKKYNNGEISQEDYNAGRLGLFQQANDIAGLASIFKEKTKEYKEMDLSSYQDDPRLLEFTEKFETGSYTFDRKGGSINMYYKDRNGNLQIIDKEDLGSSDFWQPVEKFNLAALRENVNVDLQNNLSKLTDSYQYTDEDGNTVTRQKTKFKAGYESEDQRAEQIKNKYLSTLEASEVGSIFNDHIMQKTNVANDPEFEKAIAGLSDKDKTTLMQMAKGGAQNVELSDGTPAMNVIGDYVANRMAKDLVTESPVKQDLGVSVKEPAPEKAPTPKEPTADQKITTALQFSKGKTIGNDTALDMLAKSVGLNFVKEKGDYILISDEKDEDGNPITKRVTPNNIVITLTQQYKNNPSLLDKTLAEIAAMGNNEIDTTYAQ